jgi:dTDP-glucose pyrophosphorylase
MKGPILVVLAAGMGSRYGGLKQMDQIGQSGETLLDYSVYDALHAGFEKIVFIIRHDMEKDFKELVLSRMKSVTYELAYQDMDTLIPPEIFAEAEKLNRTKPWGTAHALLCAADKIDTAAFGVINADDFYGREAFIILGNCLNSRAITQGAIVPYNLEKTLSLQGTVARGVCEIKDNCLVSVSELTAIAREEEGGIFNTAEDGSKQELAPDTPVSMNFWGFPRSILPGLRKYFFDFLQDSENLPKNECYIPRAVDWFIKSGLLSVRVLKADADWFGVTYKEDRECAVNRIAGLVASGVYPVSLWN